MAVAMKSELVVLIEGGRRSSKMGRLLRNKVSSKTSLYYELLLTLDARRIYVERESK